MNNKGQALVEFILILPVFIMILFIIIDFGMICNKKSNLESISNDAVLIYKQNKSIKKRKASQINIIPRQKKLYRYCNRGKEAMYKANR